MIVITGHYGCGKTNLAINLALQFAASGEETTLADLDIVNPYFRSSDFGTLAHAHGITLITPGLAGSTLDIPALGGQLDAVLQQPGGRVIVDVGGDDAGSYALGRYAPKIKTKDYCCLYVVNQNRNLIGTPREAVEIMREIEGAGHLPVTAIVNNTHLGKLTTAQDVEHSTAYAQAVAKLADVPLLFTTCPKTLERQLITIENLLPVDIYVKTPWDE